MIMNKKLLILSDMEGSIGMDDNDPLEYQNEKYLREIEIVLNELKKYKTVLNFSYCDIHNNGELGMSLKRKYKFIKFLENYSHLEFNERYDYAILLGFHSMNNKTFKYGHSFRDEIKYIKIGNYFVGEVGLFINILAFYKCKLIFISGDEGAIEEANKSNCMKYISHKKNENYLNEISYNEKIERMKKILRAAIEKRDLFNLVIYDCNPITVVLNKNFYGKFLFKETIYRSTTDFFLDIKNFCKKINMEKILRRVIELKELKKVINEEEENIPIEISLILNKNIWLLTKEDLIKIKNWKNII